MFTTARANAIFKLRSSGLKTGRDPWVYNFSTDRLVSNTGSMVDHYNQQVEELARARQAGEAARPTAAEVDSLVDLDPTKMSWNRIDKTSVARGVKYVFDPDRVFTASYRPFTKQHVVFDAHLNDMVYQLTRIFPTARHANFGFYVTGVGSDKPFSVHATGHIPDLAYWGSSNGQFFPRYTYQKLDQGDGLFASAGEAGYERVDNITDAALADYRRTYADATISKDDIFYYVYGLLHSSEYRQRFAADLKKSLPRVPKVGDFGGFVGAGRRLADLHIGYEQVEPHQGIVETVAGDASTTPLDELFRVTKMKFAREKGAVDQTTILYNNRVTLTNIPLEAYRYQLGARSAIEWIMDRYQLRVDKASQITNDPNDWSDNPRYIIDLLKRIVTVSLRTMEIVDSLPPLEILD